MTGIKYDGGKPQLGLLPPLAILAIGRVLTFGAIKYSPDNWRRVDNAKARYTDALLRHVFAWMRGERVDPESGEHHLAHAATCILFLLEFEEEDGSSGVDVSVNSSYSATHVTINKDDEQ